MYNKVLVIGSPGSGRGTEIIFPWNLFRCPTPARLTRIKKLVSNEFLIQSTTAKTCVYNDNFITLSISTV